jgi:hypothetical protein
MTKNSQLRDEDAGKGAVEQDSRDQPTNVSFAGQNPHRDQDPLLKSSDSDFPESGQNPEHSGEKQEHNQLSEDSGCNPEGLLQDHDPGFRQKENQNKSKDDPLAA